MNQTSTNSYETDESDEAPQLELEMAQETATNAAESSQEDEAHDECVTGMDLQVYKAATTGNRIDDDILSHGEGLSQILTPTKNTVLHIYIACAKRSRGNTNTANDTNAVVMRILIRCPALLFQPNEQGDTPLHIAARLGHDDIVYQLLNASNPHQQSLIATVNHAGDTALHEAVRLNHPAVVTILTRADPEALYSANAAGKTPLYMAVRMGYNDIASEILGTCSNPAYDGPEGSTALHAAALFNNEQMMNKLLEHYSGNDDEKALARAVDDYGWTPLHYAASLGYSSIVKQLLGPNRCAAYVREKNDKMTALHVAASRGHLDVIKELISHCPDCWEVVDKRHLNIIHYAIANKHFQIQEFVLKDPWLSHVLLYGKTFTQQLLVAPFEINDHIEPFDPPGTMTRGNDFTCDVRVDTNNNAFEKEGQGIELAAEELNQAHLKVNDDVRGKELLRQELQQSNLIVATLIAAVTFTAGMAVPGGVESEGPDRGLAVLRKSYGFFYFSWFNTAAMICSCSSFFLHSYWLAYKPYKTLNGLIMLFTWYAVVCMVVGFIFGTYAVLGLSLGSLVWLCALMLYASVIFSVHGICLVSIDVVRKYCYDIRPHLRYPS